jgi:hypothetical protein
MHRVTYIVTDKQIIDGQIDRQMERYTNGEVDKQTDKYQTDRQIDGQTGSRV